MRVEELVGGRVKVARQERGWTQEQLGAELGRYLEGGWSNIVVSFAETGRRGFTAAELVALAAVLGKPVAWLFSPFDDEREIELPGGSLASEDYRALGRPEGEVGAMLTEFADELVTIQATALDMLARIRHAAQEMERAGVQVPDDLVVIPAPPGTSVEDLAAALKRSVEQGKAITTRKRTNRKAKKGGRK
jgi:transcriptional regulator with XRE-family HTH domain